MILVAVVVGYVLGIAPFIYLKISDKAESVKAVENSENEEMPQEILDEWLNGPKKINQEDIYEEYVTGKAVSKGE